MCVVRAVLEVQVHLGLGERRVKDGRGVDEGFDDDVGMPLLDLFHLLGIVMVHLKHADPRLDQLVGDMKNLVAAQRDAGELATFAQGDVAKLEILGKRHLGTNLLREAVLRDPPKVGGVLQFAVDRVSRHVVIPFL